MPDLPKHKSKAHRVETFSAETGFGAPVEEEEKQPEEPTLTPEQLAAGIQAAREAVNAPPSDLASFEEALKKKHEELQAAGVKP